MPAPMARTAAKPTPASAPSTRSRVRRSMNRATPSPAITRARRPIALRTRSPTAAPTRRRAPRWMAGPSNGSDPEAGSSFESGTHTLIQTGNSLTGSYSQHEVTTGSGSAFNTGTTTATHHPADLSSLVDVALSFASNYQTTSSTVDKFGNYLTGDFSIHQVDNNTTTVTSTDSDSSTDDFFDDSVATDGSGDTTTDTLIAGTTYDSTGNDSTGYTSAYQVSSSTSTQHDTGSDGGTQDPVSGTVLKSASPTCRAPTRRAVRR